MAKGSRPALLWSEWLQQIKLDWSTIFSVNPQIGTEVDRSLSNHKHLFDSSGEGTKEFKATLKLKRDQQPVIQKARPGSYSIYMREVVEEELDRLDSSGILFRVESSGILFRVESSERTSPTVNVQKMKNVGEDLRRL